MGDRSTAQLSDRLLERIYAILRYAFYQKLVDRFQCLEPSFSSRDDFVGVGFPDEAFGLAVAVGDEAVDLRLADR